MRPVWLAGFMLAAIGLAMITSSGQIAQSATLWQQQVVTAPARTSVFQAVANPCPPNAPSVAWQGSWVDNCSSWDRWFSPVWVTGQVYPDGRIIETNVGPGAPREDSHDNPNRTVMFFQNETVLFRKGGTGYYIGGEGLGDTSQCSIVFRARTTGVGTNAVRNPRGQDVLDAGCSSLTTTLTPSPQSPVQGNWSYTGDGHNVGAGWTTFSIGSNEIVAITTGKAMYRGNWFSDDSDPTRGTIFLFVGNMTESVYLPFGGWIGTYTSTDPLNAWDSLRNQKLWDMQHYGNCGTGRSDLGCRLIDQVVASPNGGYYYGPVRRTGPYY